MTYQLGETAYVSFTTNDSTGAAVNADSLPTASLVRNGAVDGDVTVAVANLSTGAYVASFAVPGGYSVGDDLEVLISATVDSIAAKLFKGQGKVDSTVASRAVAGDAMALAADALNAAALAASAVAEIQSGLSTLDAAGVRTALGMASADLDDQLAAIAASSGLSVDQATLLERIAGAAGLEGGVQTRPSNNTIVETLPTPGGETITRTITKSGNTITVVTEIE